MHITIVALGSRGDVQPVVALGVGLIDAGYQVRIATFRTFADIVREHGLEFAPIIGDPRQTLQGQTGQVWQQSGKNPVKFITMLRKLFSPEHIRRSLNDTVEACRGTDAILYTPLGAAGYHVAEMMGIPKLYLLLQPVSRTREQASIFMPQWKLGAGYNWISHQITEQLMWQTLRVQANRWRQESLKLSPVPFWGPFNILYKEKAPLIYAYSQHVVPRPNDIPDWHHITGYWFLESRSDWSLPAVLIDFLSQSPKPIYIGFGSMSGPSARGLVKLAIDSVAAAKQRAVLVGGWAEAQDLPLTDNMYSCQFVPHDWLFPRVAAVVHHGGAGTTAAGLKAGLPTVVVPFMGDQFYWGKRVFDLGVGPEPVSRKNLSVDLLAEKITQVVNDQFMIKNAGDLGIKIREEGGVKRAVQLINKYLVKS
ncbi:MAG: glycosyltransferase [Anaerolineales bacterium]